MLTNTFLTPFKKCTKRILIFGSRVLGVSAGIPAGAEWMSVGFIRDGISDIVLKAFRKPGVDECPIMPGACHGSRQANKRHMISSPWHGGR